VSISGEVRAYITAANQEQEDALIVVGGGKFNVGSISVENSQR
jgi:hypothetical protein